MENNSLALLILVEAKTEYTHQLTNILVPRLKEGIDSLYKESKNIVKDAREKILITFQTLLSNIPKWNDDIIKKEYSRIIHKSECQWLDDLIIAVFICYTKILGVVKVNDKIKKPIDLEIPSGFHFVHQCYIELARSLWENPYPLYDINVNNYEKQLNSRDLNIVIEESIVKTIRKMLPVKSILKEYLGKDYIQENQCEEDIKKLFSGSHKKNLEKMVKKVIEESKKGKQVNIQKMPPLELDIVEEKLINLKDSKDNKDNPKLDEKIITEMWIPPSQDSEKNKIKKETSIDKLTDMLSEQANKTMKNLYDDDMKQSTKDAIPIIEPIDISPEKIKQEEDNDSMVSEFISKLNSINKSCSRENPDTNTSNKNIEYIFTE